MRRTFEGLEHRSWVSKEKDHGRVETRHYHVVEAPEEFLARYPEWKGLRTLGMVYRERKVGREEASEETAFYISSMEPKVKQFAEAVRGHWSVENSLHWVLDVGFREDENRIRKGHAPENLAMLRRTALSLLKNDKKGKGGLACRRKQAGWNNAYLLRVLLGQSK